MIGSLEEVKGIGERVRDILIEYHGSEKEAINSLENHEFEKLVNADIPISKSIEIAKYIFEKSFKFSYKNITKTKESKALLNKIFEKMGSYPNTDFGRVGIGLFHPTLDMNEIMRRQDYLQDCIKAAKKVSEKKDEIESLFSQMSTIKKDKYKIDDTIAVEDPALYEDLTKQVGRIAHIILVEAVEDLEYLVESEFVRYVQKDSKYSSNITGLSNVEPVFEEDIESIVPEIVLSFFSTNRDTILAAIKIGMLSRDQEMEMVAKEIAQDLKDIESLDMEAFSRGYDQVLDDLELAIKNIEEVAQAALKRANEAISERIGGMELKGKDLFTILASSKESSILESLPIEFHRVIEEIAGKEEMEAAEKIKINRGLIRGLFITDAIPLTMDTHRLLEIKKQLVTEKRRAELEAKRRVAKSLSPHIPRVLRLIRGLMDLDLMLSLGWFSIDQNLTMPVIQNKVGVGFKKGRNLNITGVAHPSDYVIGESDLFPDRRERAAVITGANSGGKTTLLELVGQIVLLTHMGLGVPAESAKISLFDEIYYFAKGQGTDAGAFESMLSTFDNLGRTKKKRLILADEIEAITEPGAAAKILAALLEWYNKDYNTLTLIVTHLGEDIREQAGDEIRIDGIEASGLDKDLNLIVDRNPVLGALAKSTPELIVEKLSKQSPKNGFYKWILNRFKN